MLKIGPACTYNHFSVCLHHAYLRFRSRMANENHFIIKHESYVDDMLNGIGASFPGLSVEINSRIVLHAKNSSSIIRKVGLLTGGGSGHEPFAAGFVGDGMLTAAVAGSLFSSPPSSHILSAICNVASISPGGVFIFILNYTGDVLNFGLAVERAKQKGYNVKSIIIDDDCAIENPEGAGKRGLCGCLFLFKIAGAMSLLSKDLEEINYECFLIKEKIATLGVTIKPCNMPGLGPMFQVDDGYMEIGIGIHGEAGASQSEITSADKIVGIILKKLCNILSVKSGDKVCIIVNNLGGTPQLELFLIAGQVFTQLKTKGIEVVRHYTGSLMTSLDMYGIQVSMMALPKNYNFWLDCLDAPTTAFAWPGNVLSYQGNHKTNIIIENENDLNITGPEITDENAEKLKKCLKATAEALIENEHKLNELDKGCGDGDTGSTLRRMANAIQQDLHNLPVKFPQQCFMRLSKMAEDVMGGTSGALYSLMFIGASNNTSSWVTMWQGSMDIILKYSKARIGSRTMFDALIPAFEEFKNIMSNSGNWQEALYKAVEAADNGCKNTLLYKPLFGRATYVQASNLTSVDAGAYAVTVWLHAIQSQLV